MNELKSSVLFFRQGKFYYFRYNGKIFKLNRVNVILLKEELSLPFKISFFAMSRAQIGRVISDLLNEETDVKLKRIKSEKCSILKYEVVFYQMKNNKKLLLKK